MRKGSAEFRKGSAEMRNAAEVFWYFPQKKKQPEGCFLVQTVENQNLIYNHL